MNDLRDALVRDADDPRYRPVAHASLMRFADGSVTRGLGVSELRGGALELLGVVHERSLENLTRQGK